MQLVAQAADERLGRSIAAEGGMPSILWAGDRRKDERRRVAVELAIMGSTAGLTEPPTSV